MIPLIASGRIRPDSKQARGKIPMKDDDCNDDTQSFILRIWNDAPAGSGKMKIWRGSIVHVGSGKRIYFHNLNSIAPFIQKQTGIRSATVGDWLKSLFGKARQKQN